MAAAAGWCRGQGRKGWFCGVGRAMYCYVACLCCRKRSLHIATHSLFDYSGSQPALVIRCPRTILCIHTYTIDPSSCPGGGWAGCFPVLRRPACSSTRLRWLACRPLATPIAGPMRAMRAMRAIYSAVGIAAKRGSTDTLHRVEQVSNTGNPGSVQEGCRMGGSSKCKRFNTEIWRFLSGAGRVGPTR